MIRFIFFIKKQIAFITKIAGKDKTNHNIKTIGQILLFFMKATVIKPTQKPNSVDRFRYNNLISLLYIEKEIGRKIKKGAIETPIFDMLSL